MFADESFNLQYSIIPMIVERFLGPEFIIAIFAGLFIAILYSFVTVKFVPAPIIS